MTPNASLTPPASVPPPTPAIAVATATAAAAGADAGPDAVRALARLARILERSSGGLGLSQYRVLMMVAAGNERASRLARALALGKPAVSAAVEALVNRELLERVEVVGDQRAVGLRLTQSGAAALADSERSMAERLAEILADADHPGETAALLGELNGVLDRHLAGRASRRTGR